MQKNHSMEDEKIVKGFNAGYEIARKDLNLARTLSESYKGEKTDYVLAFEKGIQELILEEKFKAKEIASKEKKRNELDFEK